MEEKRRQPDEARDVWVPAVLPCRAETRAYGHRDRSRKRAGGTAENLRRWKFLSGFYEFIKGVNVGRRWTTISTDSSPNYCFFLIAYTVFIDVDMNKNYLINLRYFRIFEI